MLNHDKIIFVWGWFTAWWYAKNLLLKDVAQGVGKPSLFILISESESDQYHSPRCRKDLNCLAREFWLGSASAEGAFIPNQDKGNCHIMTVYLKTHILLLYSDIQNKWWHDEICVKKCWENPGCSTSPKIICVKLFAFFQKVSVQCQHFGSCSSHLD